METDAILANCSVFPLRILDIFSLGCRTVFLHIEMKTLCVWGARGFYLFTQNKESRNHVSCGCHQELCVAQSLAQLLLMILL